MPLDHPGDTYMIPTGQQDQQARPIYKSLTLYKSHFSTCPNADQHRSQNGQYQQNNYQQGGHGNYGKQRQQNNYQGQQYQAPNYSGGFQQPDPSDPGPQSAPPPPPQQQTMYPEDNLPF